MTYEPMITITISFFSLIIAFISMIRTWRTSKAQQKLQQEHLKLAEKQTNISEQLGLVPLTQKYSAILQDSYKKSVTLTRDFYPSANKAMNVIFRIIDEVDTKGRMYPRLSHKLNELAEEISRIYCWNLSISEATDISRYLTDLKRTVNELSPPTENSNIFTEFYKKIKEASKSKNQSSYISPYLSLMNSSVVEECSVEIFRRIPEQKEEYLISRFVEALSDYNESQSNLVRELAEVSKNLSEALNDIDFEFYHSDKVPRITISIKQLDSEMGRYKSLCFPEIEALKDHPKSYGLPHIIYIVALLACAKRPIPEFERN